MHTHYVNSTKHMAKLNPGYDVHHFEGNVYKNLSNKNPDTRFMDFSVKEKMFTFFLINGCLKGTPEHHMTEKIVNNNPWTKPITVYGYDDTWGILGDPYEAETLCVEEHNMGQVASVGVSNLGFFSREEPISEPLKANPDPETGDYDAEKTYVAFVVGDGDALYDVKGNMFNEMLQRVEECKDTTCYPLIWSISPQLIHVAPYWLQWFYEKALQTGRDYFILPPSGDLYAYPSRMSGDDRMNFVKNTERDCELLSTSGTMAWEWFYSWEHAIESYFPLYSDKNTVKGFFAIDVPYPIPIVAFKGHYKFIDGNSVLFKPLADWMKTDGSHSPLPFPDPKDNMEPA